MKIKHLWISKYKNIEDQTFDFNGELISLFVGKNGLGKSNLFEAIAVIFRNLDLANTESDITKDFDYKIVYEVKGNLVKLDSISTVLKIATKTADYKGDFKTIKIGSFKTNRVSKYLPDFIIGYYSGENKRIKALFAQHIKKRIYNLKKSSPAIDIPLLGRMFFSDQLFGELIFFTLWVYKNSEKYGAKIQELLTDFISIDAVSKVNIKFNSPEFYKNPKNNDPNKEIEKIHSNINNDKILTPFWGIKGSIDNLLRALYNNHIERSEPIAYRNDTYDSSTNNNEFIHYNNLNYSNLEQDLKGFNIESPLQLFDALLASDSIGCINEIETVISRNANKFKHDFSGLSEGEQQLLTVLGLTLISSEYDTLFILDEPDTHLNPQWQRDYVSLVKKFTLEKSNSQVLVATHSPLIVQSSEKADVFLFKKDGDEVKIENEDYKIHNWRIDHVLMSEYFGLDSARPPALDDYMILREKIINNSNIEDKDSKLAEFQNEYGVLPTGETIVELEALQLINSLKKTLTDDKDKKD